jgi:hypothetical protein
MTCLPDCAGTRIRVLMGGQNHTGWRSVTQKHNYIRESGARSAESSP